MARKTIFDFRGGQVSKRFKGRVDSEIYHRSCETLKNFRVWPTGGIERVPGTVFVRTTTSNKEARLFPFVAENGYPYVVVMTLTDTGNSIAPILRGECPTSLTPDGAVGSVAENSFYQYNAPDVIAEKMPHDYENLEQLQEIQYCQDAIHTYFSHPTSKVQVLDRDSDTSWPWSNTAMSGADATDQGQNFLKENRSTAGGDQLYATPDSSTPKTVGFYQGRFLIAGMRADPGSIVASRSSGAEASGALDPNYWQIMEVSDADSTTQGWSYKQISSGIVWLMGWKELLVGTHSGEYSWGEGIIDLKSPPTVSQVGNSGSFNRQPLFANGRLLFVQRGGMVIKELTFTREQNAYNARNMTLVAEDILGTTAMKAWCFQQNPIPTVWVVRGDGKIAMLTYDLSNEVIAWNTVDVDGEVESICCVPGATEDQVWMVVKRTMPDDSVQRHIEYFVNSERLDKTDPWHVFGGIKMDTDDESYTIEAISNSSGKIKLQMDSALANFTANEFIRITKATKTDTSDLHQICTENTGGGAGVWKVTNPTSGSGNVYVELLKVNGDPSVYGSMGAITADSGTATRVINTITAVHLPGETVTVSGDGSEEAQVLLDGSGVGTTKEYYQTIVAGLGVDADCVPLGLDTPDDFGEPRAIRKVKARMVESNCLQVGPDEDNVDAVTFRQIVDKMDEAPSLSSEIVERSITQKVSKTGKIVLRAPKESNMACNIAGLVVEYET